MRQDWPSLTAMFVALARALATRDRVLSRACHDPFAEALLPLPVKPMLEHIEPGVRGESLGHALQALTFGLSHHLALRTALIDRALQHGVDEGIEQVVLLGAGLDARAHRMAALHGVRVYEVDHPATQRFKRQRAVSLPVAARALDYVECDFERSRLDESLTRAGFDARRRSLWVWEGVTMYLPERAIVDSLQAMARMCAADSLLIATYLTPEIAAGGRALAKMSTRLLALLAEPVRFVAESGELAARLAAYGFRVLNDTAPRDAAPHFGLELGRFASLLPAERLVVARKLGETR